MTHSTGPIVILSSGHSIVLEEVMLFPEEEIAKLSELRAEAARLIGGNQQATVGLIGSPEWVIGGSLAMGLLGSLVAEAKKGPARNALIKASAQHERILEAGRFFSHEAVSGMSRPSPNAWNVVETETGLVQQAPRELRMGVFGRTVLPAEEVIETRTTRFIHFEQEFLPVRNSSGSLYLKWSDVSAYRASA